MTILYIKSQEITELLMKGTNKGDTKRRKKNVQEHKLLAVKQKIFSLL
jgi:hypothetical protein